MKSISKVLVLCGEEIGKLTAIVAQRACNIPGPESGESLKKDGRSSAMKNPILLIIIGHDRATEVGRPTCIIRQHSKKRVIYLP